MNISIFIPAYNASMHIENVINRLPAALSEYLHHIYIVDDGSTDTTRAVIDRMAKENNCIVAVHFEYNKGYGSAVSEGLTRCRADGCDYAACLHADEQYPPEVVVDFIKTMESGKIDLLQGSRIASGTALSGGMPLYKFFAGKMLTVLENLVLGLGLTDYHSGMLFYSRQALSVIKFDNLSASFDFDLEAIACARTAGLKVSELPIPTRYASEKSYLNPITYGLRVLRVLFRYSGGYYRKCIG
jgi:glycosyltransferase involved in cell wall biosynthesis